MEYLEDVDADVGEDDEEDDHVEEARLPEVAVGDGEGQEAGKGREEDAQGPEEAGANAGKKKRAFSFPVWRKNYFFKTREHG